MTDYQFTLDELQHEKDKQYISKLMNNNTVEKVFQFIEDNKIEDIYSSVYKNTCIQLTKKNAPDIINALERACNTVGLHRIPAIYVFRDYNEAVEICGFNDPFILISADYLENILKEDEVLLYGILAGQAAGIRAGHHRAAMLFQFIQFAEQYVPIPTIPIPVLDQLIPLLISTGIGGVVNQWNRCRYYTYDKAFYKATNDLSLSIRSLFINRIPKKYMDKFSFGTQNDEYIKQTKNFMERSTIEELIRTGNTILTDDTWIPERYVELLTLHNDSTKKLEAAV